MDITALLSGWKDPAVVLAFIVGLAITIKFLSSKINKTEKIVENIRENHLTHIGESLIRIETEVKALPCRSSKYVCSEIEDKNEDWGL